MRQFAVAVAIITVSLALAQEQLVTFSQSWDDWQPTPVEMPEPNAFDQYQIAFALLENFEAPEPDATDDEVRASIMGFETAYQTLMQAQEGECRFPPLTEPGQLFPEMAGARNAARFLATVARVSAAAGRTAQAALDCVACIRLGAAAATNQTLIGGLVACACEELGMTELALITPKLQAAECEAVIEALQAAHAARIPLPVLFEGEALYGKMMMKQQFQGMASPDANQDEFMSLTPEQRAEALQAWEDTLRQMGIVTWDPDGSWLTHEEWFERLAEETAKPYWAREVIPQPGDMLVKALVPVNANVQMVFAIADARLALALCQLGARAYIATENGLPDALDALVDKYLDAVPGDPFRDAPLSSTVVDDQLVIYSIGPDREDNSGAPIEEPATPESLGDMVVTP